MPIIKVRPKTPSFRRGGIAFTAEGVELDTKELTKEQLKAIEAEPQLIVEEIEAESEGKKSKKSKKSKKETGDDAGVQDGGDESGK